MGQQAAHSGGTTLSYPWWGLVENGVGVGAMAATMDSEHSVGSEDLTLRDAGFQLTPKAACSKVSPKAACSKVSPKAACSKSK